MPTQMNSGANWTRDNALARSDLWILLPVAVEMVIWLCKLPFGESDFHIWIASAVAILIGVAVLSTAIFYSRWAVFVVTGFLGTLLINIMMEYGTGNASVGVQTLFALSPLACLSCVLVFRRWAGKQADRDASPSDRG